VSLWLAAIGAVLLVGTAPLSAASAAVPTLTGPYAPRDACSRQAGASAFRRSLASVVRRRDEAGLLALAASDVRLDFGQGGGRAELRRRLRADRGKLWRELDRLMPLGCAMQQGSVIIPSIFAADMGDIDPFEVMLVTGARVPLRAAPSAAARPLRLLSWLLVEPVSGADSARPFREVRVKNGPTGYVATALLRNPADYRILASRHRGRWLIDAFVAGD
jgi:hypothetical protein